ncbi:MAG: hypothetical protein V3V78_03910 [Candidatus Woesearchaeota archaeon]
MIAPNYELICRELTKVDMKFAPGEGIPRLEFLIEYEPVTDPETGIVIVINKKRPDIFDNRGRQTLPLLCPFSFSGLEAAREYGLQAARNLYSLPDSVFVVEGDAGEISPDMNFNQIYRLGSPKEVPDKNIFIPSL